MNDQRCFISASDEMDRLRAVTLYMYASTPMPQTSDAILKDILNYAGVDAALRRLDGGLTLVPGSWSPPLWGRRAIDEIHRLQDEEDGFVYIDGRGYWRMENRAHRTIRRTTPRAQRCRRTTMGAIRTFALGVERRRVQYREQGIRAYPRCYESRLRHRLDAGRNGSFQGGRDARVSGGKQGLRYCERASCAAAHA